MVTMVRLADLSRWLGSRVSYRQLDYWARTGRLRLGAHATPGSGRLRLLTASQAAAVIDLVELLEQAARVESRVASGEYFADRVAFWRSQPDDVVLARIQQGAPTP